MKDIFQKIKYNEFHSKELEKLSINELNNIRGGNSDERGSTKESDVYDKREV